MLLSQGYQVAEVCWAMASRASRSLALRGTATAVSCGTLSAAVALRLTVANWDLTAWSFASMASTRDLRVGLSVLASSGVEERRLRASSSEMVAFRPRRRSAGMG